MVNAVPEGYATLTPYLVVKDAGAAIDFYVRAFGAVEKVRMTGPGGAVVHGEVQIGSSMLMLGAEMLEQGARAPQTVGGTATSVMIYTDGVDAAFARAIKAGCTSLMDPMDMFWGDRFGKLRDPFGHEWSIAQHMEDVSPEDMEKRQAAFFSGQQG